MELSQKIGLFDRQHILLMEDKVLVRLSGLTSTTEFSVNYDRIDRNPTRVRRLALAWSIWAGLILLTCVGLCITAWNARLPDNRAVAGGLAVLAGIIAAILAVEAKKRSFDWVFFAFHDGRFGLRHNRPDPEAFRQFLLDLQEKIASQTDADKLITRKLLDWLHAEGFLDEWKLKEAKTRLQVPIDPPDA